MAQVAIVALILGWLALVFGTTACAVFWLGHSGWWFALAMVIASLSAQISGVNGGEG